MLIVVENQVFDIIASGLNNIRLKFLYETCETFRIFIIFEVYNIRLARFNVIYSCFNV